MQSYRFDTVDSTNDVARRLVAEGRITGCAVVIAREQTAGRGTSGRSWLSPRDAGLYLSLISTNLGSVTSDTTLHTLAAGVACAEAITAATGIQVLLKPVNDLIAGGGKLGGILTEAIVESGRLAALITGIGINTRRADRRPAGATLRPVSLEELMDADAFIRLRPEMLLNELVKSVVGWHRVVSDGRAQHVHSAFAALACAKGCQL